MLADDMEKCAGLGLIISSRLVHVQVPRRRGSNTSRPTAKIGRDTSLSLALSLSRSLSLSLSLSLCLSSTPSSLHASLLPSYPPTLHTPEISFH
jgi:hypothetical protein